MSLHSGRMTSFGMAILLALSLTSPSHGQTLKATILGTITDSTGGVIPSAQVVVIETGTNARRTASTNDTGLYAVANLDPGIYRVEVEHPGFRRVTRANIDLPPNNTVRIDLELPPGAVSEVVDVTAEAPILKTDRSDTGGQIQTMQLQNMPLGLNRNYAGTLVTLPGIPKLTRPRSEFFNSQDSLVARVNGQGVAANNFQIEGIDNNVENNDLTGIVPPVESIQTVDVSTTNYDSEFGRAGGAVVNVTIRSGTNDLHGSLFHFHKNENMQAFDVLPPSSRPRSTTSSAAFWAARSSAARPSFSWITRVAGTTKAETTWLPFRTPRSAPATSGERPPSSTTP